MGLRFSRCVRLAKGVYLNFSKSGVGLSVGVRGFRVGVGPRGPYVSAGIPGTGLYAVEYLDEGARPKGRSTGTKASGSPALDGHRAGGPPAARIGAWAFALPAEAVSLAPECRWPPGSGGTAAVDERPPLQHPRRPWEALAALRGGLRPPLWVRLRSGLMVLTAAFALLGGGILALIPELGLLYERPYRAVVHAFASAGRSVPPTALTALAAAHLTEGHADAALMLLAQVGVPRRQADAWIRSVRFLRAKAHLLLGREAAARRELALLAALGEGGGSTEALLASVENSAPICLWKGEIALR